MSEREGQLEQAPEQKEYPFEEGFEEILRRIDVLLEMRPFLVIAVTGSSHDVGKTLLSTKLVGKLAEKGIPTAWATSIRSIAGKLHFGHGTKDKRILILHNEFTPRSYTTIVEDIQSADADHHKTSQNVALIKKAQKFGLPFGHVDLRVFVYRPDKPFDKRDIASEFADIIIRNEKAVDKPRR